jgi:hypothetical protein
MGGHSYIDHGYIKFEFWDPDGSGYTWTLGRDSIWR